MLDFIIFIGRAYIQIGFGFFIMFASIMLYGYSHRRDGWLETIVGAWILGMLWPFSIIVMFEMVSHAKARRGRWPEN